MTDQANNHEHEHGFDDVTFKICQTLANTYGSLLLSKLIMEERGEDTSIVDTALAEQLAIIKKTIKLVVL